MAGTEDEGGLAEPSAHYLGHRKRLRDRFLAAGVLPGFYVESIALAPNGCWPLGLPDHYPADLAHLAEYARMAATAEGFARYVEQHVHARQAA